MNIVKNVQKEEFLKGTREILSYSAFLQNYGFTFDQVQNKLSELYDEIHKKDPAIKELSQIVHIIIHQFDAWLESFHRLNPKQLKLVKVKFYDWEDKLRKKCLEIAIDNHKYKTNKFEGAKIIPFIRR